MDIWAIIPVKSLQQSKSRLASALSPAERSVLAQQLLAHLLQLLRDQADISQTLVVTRDETVTKLAHRFGALTMVEDNDSKMNGAIAAGRAFATAGGASHVFVLPWDLPHLSSPDINAVVKALRSAQTSFIICPDRHEQGTNGLLIPLSLAFRFQFGPNSFQYHLEEGARLGWPVQIIRRPGWGFDLDTEEDWQLYTAPQLCLD